MPRKLFLLVSFAAVLVGGRTLHAEVKTDHAPRLTIATASGKDTFHIGERIPLVLSFTGPKDKRFAIDLASYDRSGRMSEDTFNVEPKSGWADPLAAYFRYGSYMGGLRGGQSLSSKPVTIKANLNEWVRFNEPGTYILTVTSHRVGPTSKRMEGFPHDEIDLVSANSVKLIIVSPTAEWQDEALSRIVRDLPKNRTGEAKSDELNESQENAYSDLRYLATAAAVRLLAAQLRDDGASESDAYFGIIGLPHEEREGALVSMRLLLDQPEFPVDMMFLEAMSWLRMPDERESAPHETLDKEVVEAYEAKRLEARDGEWQTLVLALHKKKGAALHATETTLLETEPVHPDPSITAVLGALTRASFPHMSAADQTRALEEHWDLIGSRELLAQLREIAKAPPAPRDEGNPFFSPRARIAIALQRWYELEPENATAEAIHQIGRAYPQLYAKEVSFLPDEPFPQFETLWAEALAEGDDIDDYQPAASLLLRFGTGAASPRVAEILRHPKDQLGNRLEPALAYLLKFDQSSAEAVLQKQPSLVMGRLDSIAKETSPSALLTAVALRQLDSSDPNATADALAYLRHYGDEQVREPIHQAFLRWYGRNKGLVDKDLSDLPEDVQAQLNLGDDYLRALLCNQGWLPDARLKSDAAQRTVGPWMKQRADDMVRGNSDVTVFGGDGASYEIGAFEAPSMALFEAKLDQFPAGTTFVLQHVMSGSQHSQDLLEASLSELFTKHGMKLAMPRVSTLAER
jgi:hypothetical protein